MTLPVLRDDSLARTPDGFCLRLSLPWIRSLPFTSLAALRILVDGMPVDDLHAARGDQRVPVAELGEETAWWFLQDRLELHGSVHLPPGSHEIDVSFTLSIPYLQSAPDAPLTLPFHSVRTLSPGGVPTVLRPPAAAEPTVAEPTVVRAGWVLGASSFNWTPDLLRAARPAHDIVVGIAGGGVARVIELEAGQVWRSFPEPSTEEVDTLREDLTATGGSIAVVGLNLDEWSSPGRRRTAAERLAFIVPQLAAARRVGATGVRLPIGQAGPALLQQLLPLLHDQNLTLYEEVQGQQTPQTPAYRQACETIMTLDDPRLRFVVDISILMPAVPLSYLERLEAGGLPAPLIERLAHGWREPGTHDAVLALLRSGGVPPAVHTLYMDLLIRFGRSTIADLRDILPFTGAVHLKFWDLNDDDDRISQPIRDLAGALAGAGFAGTLVSEWGGHEWLDDDPTDMTRRHLSLAHTALSRGVS